MRLWKFVGTKTITPGNTVSYDVPAGRYMGLLVRLTGTTTTSQTLAASEIGNLRVQRNGNIIQARSFEFYHNWNDLHSGFPEATLPEAGATAITCVIPFYAPRLTNTMEVRNDDELKLFFDPASGLSTEFSSNAITVEVYGIIDQLSPELYELHVRTQDTTASSTGKKSISLSVNNAAVIYLESTVVGDVQLDVDEKTIIPSIDLDVLNAFANMEYGIEASGNTLIPIPTGAGRNLGAFLNENVNLYPTFDSTGDLDITVFSLQPSPQGVRDLSIGRAAALTREANDTANRKLVTFQRRG